MRNEVFVGAAIVLLAIMPVVADSFGLLLLLAPLGIGVFLIVKGLRP